MSTPRFSGIAACVFDAYGTLFDVHSPVGKVASKLGADADAISALWRQKQLEYTWLRSLMGAHADFWQVTGDALDYALASHAIADKGLREELMTLYLTLDAYPDAAPALAALREAGLKTAILSNGSPEMLHSAVDSAGLADRLDAVISVEDVGIYKPAPRVYQRAVSRLRAGEAGAICFVSANPWDAQGGAHFGYQVARVNRFGLRDDNIPGRPHALIKTLEDLPDLVAG